MTEKNITREKIKRYSPEIKSLQDEPAELLEKSRVILEFLGETTEGLELPVSDFPDRCWMAERRLAGKSIMYDIQQAAEGWRVTKITCRPGSGYTEAAEFVLNDDTLEISRKNLIAIIPSEAEEISADMR